MDRIGSLRALDWRRASRWAGRLAVTWLLLASGVLGVVVIGIDLAADRWPSWPSVLMTPVWWWIAIRRISADVVHER